MVTSYNPLARDVTLEETGANTETDKQFLYNTYTELLKDVDPKPGVTLHSNPLKDWRAAKGSVGR